MGISLALDTALSGLSSSQQQIDVVGNNIANVNTIGYKSTSIDFKTQFLQTLSQGTAPSSETGGTNPLQIGLGVETAGLTTDFTTDGSPDVTGVPSNLAISGGGFFILASGTQQVYTRDGSFQTNGLNQLVSSTGQIVQGFGVDSNFNIVPGVLTNITIPVGSDPLAQATTNITMKAALNPSGNVATTVTNLTSNSLYLSLGPGLGADPTNPPTTATLLTDVTDSAGNPSFQVGDVINLSALRGGNKISTTPQTLTVTAATTLGDLQKFMTGSLGINTSTGANGSIATTPGGSIVTGTGALSNTAELNFNGNPGAANDLTIPASDITITRAGSTVSSPISFTQNAAADGSSVTSKINAFDSLGNTIPVDITVAQTGTNTWQVYATSPGGTATGASINDAVGLGTLTFDNQGNLTSSTVPTTVSIDRTGSGAAPTLSFTMDFSGSYAKAPAVSASGTPVASVLTQVAGSGDGTSVANLSTYSIGNDGTITGTWANGLTRTLGQVALATFQNDQGLINTGGNTYTTGPNSGNAIISAPGAQSAGTLTQGALEGSNVDLSSEFVQLIAASTAFSASSRVITSSNQLLQDLLQAAR